METEVERIDLRQGIPTQIFVGFHVLLLGIAQPHIGRILMVAQSAEDLIAEIFSHQIEVGLALPINQVAGMHHIVYIFAGPIERIAQGFFLPTAKSNGTRLMKCLLHSHRRCLLHGDA